MTAEDRANLLALCEYATPAPWRSGSDWLAHGPDDPFALLIQPGTADQDYTGADLDFIAAARSAVPDLLALVERLESEAEAERREVNILIESLHDTDIKLDRAEARVAVLCPECSGHQGDFGGFRADDRTPCSTCSGRGATWREGGEC